MAPFIKEKNKIVVTFIKEKNKSVVPFIKVNTQKWTNYEYEEDIWGENREQRLEQIKTMIKSQ